MGFQKINIRDRYKKVVFFGGDFLRQLHLNILFKSKNRFQKYIYETMSNFVSF
jgi:hypothetical protein